MFLKVKDLLFQYVTDIHGFDKDAALESSRNRMKQGTSRHGFKASNGGFDTL